MKNNVTNVVASFVGGAAVAAVSTLLSAPKSGVEVRKQIKKFAKKSNKDLQAQVKTWRKKASKMDVGVKLNGVLPFRKKTWREKISNMF